MTFKRCYSTQSEEIETMCRTWEFCVVWKTSKRKEGRKEENMSKLKPAWPATSKTDLNMEKGIQIIRYDCGLNVQGSVHIRI
jgi:hypothetical protein